MEESRAQDTPEPAQPDTGPHNGHSSTPRDALREGFARLAEIREYASYLLGVKLDAIKASGRNVLLYFVAGILGLAAGAAFAATSVVLLLLGCAHGLGELLHHDWIGEIIVAGVVLIGIAGGLVFGLKWLPRIMRKQLVSKYEARQRKQRNEFGRDVTQRARDARDQSADRSN